MMYLAALLVLGVAVSAHPGVADTSSSGASSRIVMNGYFDALLAQVSKFMLANDMVPLGIPDIDKTFKFGDLQLREGTLADLSTIRRRGDAEVTYGFRVMNIKAVVGIDLLQMKYAYSANMFGLRPSGGVEASISNVAFHVDIAVDTTTGKATLRDFDVADHGVVEVKLSGSPVLDTIFNAISGVVTNLFTDVIMDLVVTVIKLTFGVAF